MEIHHLKTLQSNFRNICLSDVVDDENLKKGTLKAVNYSINEINKLHFSCLMIKKLDLSHNRIQNLLGLFQFPNLTNLNISHNLIQSIAELKKIKNKANLINLSVKCNPFTRYPDIVPLVIQIFPRLKKLDDIKITDNLKQELFDGRRLEKKLINFFSKNLSMIQTMQRQISCMKLEYELLQLGKVKNKDGPFWEDVNARHQRDLARLQRLPVFSQNFFTFNCTTSGLNNLIDSFGKSVHDLVEENYGRKEAALDLFKKIMLKMHSWGAHGIQLYIHENMKNQDSPEEELDVFLSLSVFAQIKKMSLECTGNNFGFNEEALNIFPVFPLNSLYLKALHESLLEQVKTILELYRELEELLCFDASSLGIPSLAHKHYLIKQDALNDCSMIESVVDISKISFSDAKEDSPIAKVHSRRYSNYECEEEKDEKLEDLKKILEFSDEIQKIKENSLRSHHVSIETRMSKLKSITLYHLSKALNQIISISQCKAKKYVKNFQDFTKSTGFFKRLYSSKAFSIFKNILSESKFKIARAQEFYEGRVKLDTFYCLKHYTARLKRKARALKTKKIQENIEKSKIRQEVRQEFNKVVSRLTENEANIKRIWKILKDPEVPKCRCGGFNCENCTTKKTKTIKKELRFLKEKIMKDVKEKQVNV